MAEPTEQPNNNIESTTNASPALPQVESPPLSPDETQKPVEMTAPPAAAESKPAWTPPPVEPIAAPLPRIGIPQLNFPHFPLGKLPISRRVRRRAVLAATVLLAAGFGAAIGGYAFRAPPPPVAKADTTALEEAYVLQKSVARLSKEVTTLKQGIETATRESRTQIAKIAERVEHAPETTGSINKPAVAAAPPPPPSVEKAEVAPMPPPRPALVQDWSLVEARSGRAVVANRGDFYEIVVGNPLPGLGAVEAIRREGNGWVVVTAKGIITPAQSSAAMPPTRGYVPYYRP